MDTRARVIAARLAIKIEENKPYSDRIGLRDASHYRRRIAKKGEKDDV